MVVRGGFLFLVFGDRGKCDEVLGFLGIFPGNVYVLCTNVRRLPRVGVYGRHC